MFKVSVRARVSFKVRGSVVLVLGLGLEVSVRASIRG